MAIGDINSSEKGTGARFNDGKAPVELIPIRLLSAHFSQYKMTALMLGQWQQGGDTVDLAAAYECLGGLRDVVFEEARVFAYGAKKYAPWNWAKGMPWSVPLACAVRHLLAMEADEELDPESGLPHRGHVACNIHMLMYYVDHYPEGDDRPEALRAR